VAHGFPKVTSDTVLVPVTVQVPNSQLSFQSKDGCTRDAERVWAREHIDGPRGADV